MSLDQRSGAIFSVVLHVALLAACVWIFRQPFSTDIIAAGEGQGSGESVIEVGVVEAGQLGLTLPRSISTIGDDSSPANNLIVEKDTPKPDPDAELIPSDKQPPKPKDAYKTDRPTANQTEQLVTKDPMRGSSSNKNVEIGRTFGSQVPALRAGVGVGSGANLGPSGVPGGSAYGRLIQSILSSNYNPPTYDVMGTQYVIVQLRIARDGRILSVVNGRVTPSHFKQRSSNDLINRDVERAIVAAAREQLPPFPNGFLMSAQEAVAEVWFRYPK